MLCEKINKSRLITFKFKKKCFSLFYSLSFYILSKTRFIIVNILVKLWIFKSRIIELLLLTLCFSWGIIVLLISLVIMCFSFTISIIVVSTISILLSHSSSSLRISTHGWILIPKWIHPHCVVFISSWFIS